MTDSIGGFQKDDANDGGDRGGEVEGDRGGEAEEGEGEKGVS